MICGGVFFSRRGAFSVKAGVHPVISSALRVGGNGIADDHDLLRGELRKTVFPQFPEAAVKKQCVRFLCAEAGRYEESRYPEK